MHLSTRRHHWLSIAVLSCLLASPAIGDMPPLENLAGTAGDGPGEIKLFWDTPVFDLPGRGGECVYEFRYADTFIDDASWNSATPLSGFNPPVSFAGDGGVELKLHVGAHTEGVVIHLDRATLQAELCIVAHLDPFIPINRAVLGQPIVFEVWKDATRLVRTDPILTAPPFGRAVYHTGDLTDDPDGEVFTFKAIWGGGTLWVWEGVLVAPVSLTTEKDMWLFDQLANHPILELWTTWGGTFPGAFGDVQFQFQVPPGAIAEDEAEILISTPVSVPPPAGMNPGVPGAMYAFQLEKASGPELFAPVQISVDYPPYMLDEFGGLGESSLRAYRYDEIGMSWELLSQVVPVLNREDHLLTFATDRLGTFALAAELDGDGDGLGDIEETQCGTQPGVADTDLDGVSDGDEIWTTRGDPNDPLKVSGEDQHGTGTGLVPGQSYYVAGRFVAGAEQSPVSNCVQVQTGGGAIPGPTGGWVALLAAVLVMGGLWIWLRSRPVTSQPTS